VNPTRLASQRWLRTTPTPLYELHEAASWSTRGIGIASRLCQLRSEQMSDNCTDIMKASLLLAWRGRQGGEGRSPFSPFALQGAFRDAPPSSSRDARRPVAGRIGPFKRPWCLGPQGGVEVRRVVGGNPALERRDQREGPGPFLRLQALLFQGAHDPRGVRVALRGVVTGTRLMDRQCRAGLHEGARGRLTAVVTHQR
jgi:hypothetical protein